MADFIAIALRGLAYAAVLQAAGAAIFAQAFGPDLDGSIRYLRDLTLRWTLVGLVATLAHAVTEPARLAGDLSGALDASLHALLLRSDFGTTLSLRLLGLALIVVESCRSKHSQGTMGVFGAALIVASFAFIGHTASDSNRWLLAPLLLAHLAVVAFWFGSLLPLSTVALREFDGTAGRTIARYSRLATWLVPSILIAGLAMAGLLLPDFSSLLEPYGLLLLAKIGGFALLMGLAAANKWRFGPRIAKGEAAAVEAFRRTVAIEWTLILTVVLLTAVMTAKFSPES